MVRSVRMMALEVGKFALFVIAIMAGMLLWMGWLPFALILRDAIEARFQ